MSFLSQLGLDRRELRAWAIDGGQLRVMTIVILVFPIYFADVAAAGLPAPWPARALPPPPSPC